MPVSFKPKKPVKIVAKTRQEDLIQCSECGGLQAMSNTALDLDCPVCSGTGWENLFTEYPVPASYRSGTVKRWNYVEGVVDYFGECSIKLDYKYKNLLDRASYISMDGQDWKFSFVREPGEAMGQKRIVLALSRK